MKAFIIQLENQPGGLARIGEAIADRGINITSIAGVTVADQGAVGVITNDEQGARTALQAAGLEVREIDVVPISLAHQPGTLAGAARRLANAGVNVELLLPTAVEAGQVSLLVGVTDIEKARQALGELATARA